MSGLRFLVALLLAVAIHAAGVRVDPRFASLVDPFLVVVVLQALRHDAAKSAGAGTIAGLTQDALSGGLFGLHGFAQTLVAALATFARQRFVIQQPVQIGMLCLLAAALQQATLALLRLVFLAQSEAPDLVGTIGKMATSAVLGAVAAALADKLQAWDHRRRESRRRRLRLDT